MLGFWCRAVFDFISSSPQDLSFRDGDLLTIVSIVSRNWWHAKNAEGKLEKAAEGCSYSIDEGGFEIVETTGGWIADVCREAGKVTEEVAGWLGKEGREGVWWFVMEEISKMVEVVLRKRR